MSIDQRIFNTAISGSAILASLTGDDVRALEFAAALKQEAPIVTSSDPVVLSPKQLIQASLGSLLVDASSAGGASALELGSDAAATAQKYLDLFAIESKDDRRVLRFCTLGTPAGDVSLRNDADGGTTYVTVSLSGASAAATQILYDAGNAVGSTQAGNASGIERIVVVSGDPSVPSINFNVLAFSQ